MKKKTAKELGELYGIKGVGMSDEEIDLFTGKRFLSDVIEPGIYEKHLTAEDTDADEITVLVEDTEA